MKMASHIARLVLLISFLMVHSAALLPFPTGLVVHPLQIKSLGLLRRNRDSYGQRGKNIIALGAAVKRRSDSLESSITPTNSIIAANVLLFGAAMVFPHLRQQWMKIDHRIASGETYRLLTSMFMHGSLTHLAMNCYSLSNIGPQAERIFGTRKYLAIYAGAGVLANSLTFLGGSAPYSLGASGSIFGVMGAIGAFYWINRKTLGRRADVALKSVQRNILMNVLYGMSSTNIDQWAHMGGFGAGAALAFCLAPRLDRPLIGNMRRRGGAWVNIVPAVGRRRGRWGALRSSLQRSMDSLLSTIGIADASQRSQLSDAYGGTVRYGDYASSMGSAGSGTRVGSDVGAYEEYGELREN